MAQIRDALVSGSYVSLTHGTKISDRAPEQEDVAKLYRSTPTSVHYRTPAEVRRLFDGFELVEPGVVAVSDWLPDPDEQDDPPQRGILAVIGRKP